MSDFDDLRDRLRQVREGIDAIDASLAASREQLTRLERRAAALDRRAGRRDERFVQEREQLATEAARVREEIARHREGRARAQAVEAELDGAFAAFTDPRRGISHLDDGTPILLMPVRLETRFKEVAAAGTAAGVAHELWVRIYPDDCWIDTFDPVLTDPEVQNARAYWTAVWQAGGIEAQERAAWRGLVEAHGPGRASWIADTYTPVNVAERPSKPLARDVVLTIVTEAAPDAGDAAALAAYWRAVWLADGRATAVDAAQQALEAAVGAPKAADLVRDHVPTNLAAVPGEGAAKADVNVLVGVLVFAPVDTKRSAWSRAPKVTLLPERFVFIGYQGGEAPHVAIGTPVRQPLVVGPDPSAEKPDQLHHDAKGRLVVPDELRWMSDFDRAVEVGMGLRVPLTPAQARAGFDRVLVVGVRLGANADQAASELQKLLRHHGWGRTGFALVPQGTPTNNTEAVSAGHGGGDEADRSFDDRRAPLFTPAAGWLDKRDGQWLAEYLGLDPSLFVHVRHAGGADQLVERAMHAALWPATLGYWMETLLAPVFPREVVDQARDFFTRYVLGAGGVPAVRIGAQPYGILPAVAFARMRWPDPPPNPVLTRAAPPASAFERRLHALVSAVEADWRPLVTDLSHVGKAGDPHALLLDIVGLHPGSVEWSQRYAESLMTLFNRLNLQGFGGVIAQVLLSVRRAAARQLLTNLGYAGGTDPLILDKVFSGRHNRLSGGVVDDRPLSEVEGIRAWTSSGKNYLQWLVDAARTSLQALYAQDGFLDDTPPRALLYLLLRHALQLGYHDVSVGLHERAGLYTAAQALAARADDPFLHVRAIEAVSESRYQPLHAIQPAITGSPATRVADFITSRLSALSFTWHLKDQLAAVERLVAQPTARLERAFSDHVDCCAYRLDAWRLGLVHSRLARMRNLQDGVPAEPRRGVYLGAYAWLEPLRPEHKALAPVTLRDEDLAATFLGEGDAPLSADATNQGYVHAPSLNHAVAAAVLRNGFLSNASPQNRRTLAVNLTSERVRTALALLEGIRAGQGLSDLLGYQFERGLHDRHSVAEVDKFIYELRQAFPLRLNRLTSTKVAESEAIPARNVLDGLALVNHVKASGNAGYPFGKPGLPPATTAEASAIDAEVDRLLEAHDAVADLALSEGVYQAVLGNYDRVASTYDAYARGNFPPEPDIVRTPFSGVGLTCRVALHLEAGASPVVSPIAGLAMTPRAQAEPAVNRWLASRLPPPDRIGCAVTFRRASTGVETTMGVTLRQLGLQPADLAAIVRDDSHQAMTELDDRVVAFAHATFGPRPDVPVRIGYLDRQGADFSVFEVMAPLRYLRRLVSTSRPLESTDLALVNEAQSGDDSKPFVDPQRILLVRAALAALRADLAAFVAAVEAPLADLENRRDEILADADDYVTQLTGLMARAAGFGVAQAGWGFAHAFLASTYAAILRQCDALVDRWNGRLTQFDAAIAEHDALPVGASAEERLRILRQAERAISTATVDPVPANFRAMLVTVTRPAFAAKRDQFAAVQASTRTKVSALRTDVLALLPVSDVDATAFSLRDQEDAMVRFAEDAVRVSRTVLGAIDRALAASQAQLDAHDATAVARERADALAEAARALLGPDFRVVPEFPLAPARGDELEQALAVSRSAAQFSHLTSPSDPAVEPIDFPVDTWLHGVARVRPKVHAWEQVTLLAGGLGVAEPALDALQLPVRPGDKWMGLRFAPGQALDADVLLYTAHFAAPFDKTRRQCGLLIDEWAEIVPGDTADTGLAFHHDRPDCEAPQAMLLVAPAEFRGAWQWDDLVDALHDTLDLAKLRAIEPAHVDRLPYAPLLPATVMATQARQLTIAADLALNNRITLAREEA